MASVKVKKNREWDVVNGVAVIKTAAVAAKQEQITPQRFDNQLARFTRQRDRAAARLAQAQAEFDELDKVVKDLTTLRAQVTD